MQSKILVALPVLMVSGCIAVGPDYVPPQAVLSAQFVGADGQALPDPASNEWWTAFNDRRLNTLVARGLDQNLDIETALARMVPPIPTDNG